MASCATCNATILFGGKSAGDRRFCSDKCMAAGQILTVADSIPESVVTARVWELFHGRCPRCGGPGPVDVHLSYRVWSGLVVTSYSTRQNVSCRRCGTRARLKDAGFSLVCGWWGFPWGLIWTPVQVVRNIAAIARSEDASEPSEPLKSLVRLHLAAGAAAQPGLGSAPVAPPR